MSKHSLRTDSSQPASSAGSDSDSGPALTYCTVQPDRWTFGADKIRAWLAQYLDGRVLNACAGQTVLDHEPVHRNDIDPEIEADTHHDVRALPDELEEPFDVIVYDPPFTPHQSEATYGQSSPPGYGRDVVDALDALLRPGGRVVMFGYSTVGMPVDREYRREAVGLFNTLGRQHDYLGVVSRHDPEAGTPATTRRTATVQANAVAPADHEYTDQPDGTVEMAYCVCRDEDVGQTTDGADRLSVPTVWDWIDTQLEENTLIVHNRSGVARLAHTKLVVNAAPKCGRARPRVDSVVEPTALTERFSQVFDTVVFAPPASAFQATTEYRGDETGLSTAIKREIHEVLKPGGKVIQLGRTASCMRSDFGYEREAVAIFAWPGESHDVIGAVDRKRTTDLLELAWKTATTVKRCEACFEEWTTLDPVFRVPCPQCGAAAAHKIGPRLQGGEYCLNADGTVPNAGTPLEGIHWERLRTARERLDELGDCPATDTGIHDRTADHPVQFEPVLPGDT